VSLFATNYSICHESYVTSLQPVASRIPNDWGLFDTLGSIGEFCQDSWFTNAQIKRIDLGEFKSEERYITLKSGFFGVRAAAIDSGFRSSQSIHKQNGSGIRIAKTIHTH
jgi:hypothetical protein